MKKLNVLGKAFVLMAVALMVSCEDASLEDLLSEDDAQVSESYMKTEAALYNLYSMVDVVLRDSLFQANDSAVVDGATVLRNGGDITVDFGTGVKGLDGTTRKGVIHIVESGDYMTAASLDISLQNYYVDDKMVTGTIDLDKAGNNFALVIDKFSAGHKIEINADKTISWKNGFNTLNNHEDDVFDISGTASGLDLTENRELSTSITESMNYDRGCEFKIVSGIIDLTLNPADSTDQTTEATIDFLLSDGCDNVAKIKVVKGESEIEVTKQFKGF